MKLLLALFATLASSNPLVARHPQCPANDCYETTIAPNCTKGHACPQYIILAEACPWDCGHAPPEGCKSRCKPCPKGEICTAECRCEIVCTSGVCGPAQE